MSLEIADLNVQRSGFQQPRLGAGIKFGLGESRHISDHRPKQERRRKRVSGFQGAGGWLEGVDRHAVDFTGARRDKVRGFVERRP